MARSKREQSPIGAYHILLRSDEVLFQKEEDKAQFRQLCEKYFSDMELLSLAMLPHKIHIVFTDGGKGASYAVKPLTTSYARYYNREYDRYGKLFLDRYKSRAMNDAEELVQSVLYVDSTYGADKVCDRTGAFSDMCPPDEYDRRIAGMLERVCLDDYDDMTEDDILNFICRMTGYTSGEALALSEREKRKLVHRAARYKWVSMRRMSEALKLKRPVTSLPQQDFSTAPSGKKDTPKNVPAQKEVPAEVPDADEDGENERGGGKNLSVWLL